MTLGMSLETFTLVHVAISLIAIVSGLIVLFGMIGGRQLSTLHGLFLITTLLTSVTGFGFPIHGVTPAIVLGILSLIVLAVAILARYARHLAGGWRRTYVITASVALYFNCFVLIVQSFRQVPALHALAPTQKEPPFAVAQLVLLVLFIALTITAVKKFRSETAGAVAR